MPARLARPLLPTAVAVATLALLAASCRTAPPRGGESAETPSDHAHADGCGHVFENGAWRELPPDHVHEPGCGHLVAGGGWRFFPTSHAHGNGCGHFLVDGAWQPYAPEHVHGEGCGHFYRAGLWNPFAQGHRHDASCGHLAADGSWTSPAQDPGHAHGPGCGHRLLAGGGAVADAAAGSGFEPPRDAVRGLFRHDGAYRTLPRGSRGEWRPVGSGEDAPLAERDAASALSGSPVDERR